MGWRGRGVEGVCVRTRTCVILFFFLFCGGRGGGGGMAVRRGKGDR